MIQQPTEEQVREALAPQCPNCNGLREDYAVVGVSRLDDLRFGICVLPQAEFVKAYEADTLDPNMAHAHLEAPRETIIQVIANILTKGPGLTRACPKCDIEQDEAPHGNAEKVSPDSMTAAFMAVGSLLN